MEILRSKKLLLGLLLILIIEAGWAVWYLSQNQKLKIKNQKLEVFEPKQAVSLFLDPANGEFALEEEFRVALVLNTGKKQAIGVDAILKYDPEQLEIAEIIPGEIFDFYPLLKIEKEEILISGVSQQEKAFSGQGVLAQLKLKGKIPGETKLRFEFTPGRTTDSNVAIKNSDKDGLEEVKSGSYTFE